MLVLVSAISGGEDIYDDRIGSYCSNAVGYTTPMLRWTLCKRLGIYMAKIRVDVGLPPLV